MTMDAPHQSTYCRDVLFSGEFKCQFCDITAESHELLLCTHSKSTLLV